MVNLYCCETSHDKPLFVINWSFWIIGESSLTCWWSRLCYYLIQWIKNLHKNLNIHVRLLNSIYPCFEFSHSLTDWREEVSTSWCNLRRRVSCWVTTVSILLHSAWSLRNREWEPWSAVFIANMLCSNFNYLSSWLLHLELIVSLQVSVQAETIAIPSLGFSFKFPKKLIFVMEIEKNQWN